MHLGHGWGTNKPFETILSQKCDRQHPRNMSLLRTRTCLCVYHQIFLPAPVIPEHVGSTTLVVFVCLGLKWPCDSSASFTSVHGPARAGGGVVSFSPSQGARSIPAPAFQVRSQKCRVLCFLFLLYSIASSPLLQKFEFQKWHKWKQTIIINVKKKIIQIVSCSVFDIHEPSKGWGFFCSAWGWKQTLRLA